jgi:hypothetical protein
MLHRYRGSRRKATTTRCSAGTEIVPWQVQSWSHPRRLDTSPDYRLICALFIGLDVPPVFRNLNRWLEGLLPTAIC